MTRDDDPTHLGDSTVQPGLDMTAHGFRPGTPPTSVWMGLPLKDSDRCHVILAGLDCAVRPFVRLVHMAFVRKRRVRLWSMHIARVDNDKRLHVAAVCVGSWPQARSREILMLLHHADSSQAWAKLYRDQLARDPERIAFAGDNADAAIWVDLYLEQAVAAARAGGG